MLTLGEDSAAPLITEVHFFSFQISYGHFPSSGSSLSCIFHHLLFLALQKIHLANHIKRMADLLHVDTVQQLEVALLGSPAADVIDLLSAGLDQTRPILWTMQPHPQTYTSTPPVTIPTAVAILGISTVSTPSVEKTTESQDVPVMTLKHHHLTPMPVTSSASPLPSTSSPTSSLPSKSASYPVIVIAKLAIPVEAYPKCVNWPSSKDYLCHLCTFHGTQTSIAS